jgi:hypothetical protein
MIGMTAIGGTPDVVCLIGVKWAFSQDHLFSILFRKTGEAAMPAGLNGDAERAPS